MERLVYVVGFLKSSFWREKGIFYVGYWLF